MAVDSEVTSEKTTFSRRYGPDVFKDAIREMCEELYKTLVNTEMKANLK